MTDESDAGVLDGWKAWHRSVCNILGLRFVERNSTKDAISDLVLERDRLQERLTTAQRTIEDLREKWEGQCMVSNDLRRELDEARELRADELLRCTGLVVNEGLDAEDADNTPRLMALVLSQYGDKAREVQRLTTQVADLTERLARAKRIIDAEDDMKREMNEHALHLKYCVSDAELEIAALRIQVADLTERLERVVKLLRRYRNETPLGHQPHMIASEVDAALRGEGK